METFDSYGEAKAAGDKKVKELAKGSAAPIMTAAQGRDALAAMETLRELRRETGVHASLLSAASVFADATKRLGGRSILEAVQGHLETVGILQRKGLSDAVEEFIACKQPLTKPKDGQRAQLSAKHLGNVAIVLRRFANMHPGCPVSDLTKDHINLFLDQAKGRSAKTRNHYRASLRAFIHWCTRQDYLSRTHRLFDAETMHMEHAEAGEVEFYSPDEFDKLLTVAEGPLRAVIAIGGLGGLRTAELQRLEWSDVWRVENHIEIKAQKAKTRQRRLVEMAPALAKWLSPYKASAIGKVWPFEENKFHSAFRELCENAKVERKANGLRHAFCSYHYAKHGSEDLTAQQAGNTPAMVHTHYKGLATKGQAEAWFDTRPK